jgi:hypothetical protein
MISGIVGSKRSYLSEIADNIADEKAKPESRVKRISRWIQNDRITGDLYFLPFAEALLSHLALQTLVLVMDGSPAPAG